MQKYQGGVDVLAKHFVNLLAAPNAKLQVFRIKLASDTD
jgi:hypothetical protein